MIAWQLVRKSKFVTLLVLLLHLFDLENDGACKQKLKTNSSQGVPQAPPQFAMPFALSLRNLQMSRNHRRGNALLTSPNVKTYVVIVFPNPEFIMNAIEPSGVCDAFAGTEIHIIR